MRAFCMFDALALFCITVGAAGIDGNLLRNGSFERHTRGVPLGWNWQAGAAKATLCIDSERTRSGNAAILLANPTARAPHVYGSLSQSVSVKAGTTYTVSCYVNTEDAGGAWIGGGARWEHRFAFPRSTDGWKRVTGSFKTGPRERQFTVRILTESPTAGIFVDDVQLEEGADATAFFYVAPLSPGECRLTVSPFSPGCNLAPNGSFEEVHGVRPRGWMWDERNTDARMAIDDGVAHSGSRSVTFTNGTAFGAHVYGWFGVTGGVSVKANTVYTISAYVRSESPGTAWFGGGPGWKIRCRIPATGSRWEKVSKTFETGSDDTVFPLMVVTESPTNGFWIDDMTLREGAASLPVSWDPADPSNEVSLGAVPPPVVTYRGRAISTRWSGDAYPEDEVSFCGDDLALRGVVTLASPEISGVFRVALRESGGSRAVVSESGFESGSPAYEVGIRAYTGDFSTDCVDVSLTVSDVEGTVLGVAKRRVRMVTSKHVSDCLRRVREVRSRLASCVKRLDAQGRADYPLVSLTVLDHFIPWTEEDVACGVLDRAWATANDLLGLGTSALTRCDAALSGGASFPPVPRYVTSRLELSGASIIGAVEHPDGHRERSPVFFAGYGHFGQVRRDIEVFPDYGCNACQIEFGPRSVFLSGWEPHSEAVDDFLSVCDRASASGVSVNLLLSPHYFPGWALEEWPYLRDCHGGFFKYCVHSPDSRRVIEAFLRYVIPRIKDHRALHSLCLSNEPICVDLRGCRVAGARWPVWLRARHGRIEELNRRWGSTYSSFDEIPIPAPEFTHPARAYDFVLFNQELFAEFHAWMADIIHEMAPELPVHAKIMMSAHFGRSPHGIWSVSPELFGELSDINGNDCASYVNRRGEWNNGWLRYQMAYDFQRSVADKPIFNSENHVIVDRDHHTVSPQHIYSTLWQGALHGQSATTIWVWERTNDHLSSITGSILHRPACVEVVGRCTLDLNRLSGPVSAFQAALPQIVFVWSLSSAVHGGRHTRSLGMAYCAASFLGVPLGFVTERQLARIAEGGVLPRVLSGARCIICADVTHLPSGCASALKELHSRGIAVECLGASPSVDAYGIAHVGGFDGSSVVAEVPDEAASVFHDLLGRSSVWGLSRAAFVSSDGTRPVYGVESRSLVIDGATLIAVCNHLRDSRSVRLMVGGSAVSGEDLIGGERLGPVVQAAPMVPMLFRVPLETVE